MPEFNVTVIIENKPGISDPEGETILNDLVLKSKNSTVKKIRSGRLNFNIKLSVISFLSFFCGLILDVMKEIRFENKRMNYLLFKD